MAVAKRAGDLAESHGLRSDDAVHLAPLQRLGSPRRVDGVACWDGDLRRAASALGYALIPAWGHPPAEGLRSKIASFERLGHATVAMTLERYSQVSEGFRRGAAEAVQTLVGGGVQDDGRTCLERNPPGRL